MSDEIDPQFPFIQVHRSLPAKTAQVAAVLGLPVAQVLGGMVLVYQTLADRRILAKHKTELVLPATEVAMRLAMGIGISAAACTANLQVFVLAGLLEPRPNDHFRIRGMSLYFEAEGKRLKIKATKASRSASGPPQVDIRPTEVRGERREVRGETGEVKDPEVKDLSETCELPGMPQPPPKARKRSVGQQIYDRFQGLRSAYLLKHGGQCRPDEEEPHPAAINTWAQKFLDHLGGGPDRPNLPEDVDPVDLAAKAIEEWIPRAEWSVARGLPFKHLLTDKTREEVVAGYLRGLGLEGESAA